MDYMETREVMCDICHKMWQLGWVAANDGNLSVKLPDGNFLATPTGISKSFITPEKLVIINPEGEVLQAIDGYRPSSEIKMHLRCYKERDDVGAVLHAHPPTATGYAVAHIPLDRYTMIETVAAIGSIPVTPYGTPSTYEVPDAIAPYLQEHDVLLLANHGALTVGADAITAYYRMETLELFAKISLTAHLLGGEKEISRENIDKLIELRKYYGITGRHAEPDGLLVFHRDNAIHIPMGRPYGCHRKFSTFHRLGVSPRGDSSHQDTSSVPIIHHRFSWSIGCKKTHSQPMRPFFLDLSDVWNRLRITAYSIWIRLSRISMAIFRNRFFSFSQKFFSLFS